MTEKIEEVRTALRAIQAGLAYIGDEGDTEDKKLAEKICSSKPWIGVK